MDEKRRAHEDIRNQDYMQEYLRKVVEQRQGNQINEAPLDPQENPAPPESLTAMPGYRLITEMEHSVNEDALEERKELVSALAQIREDHFHYGRGYDSLMDAMVQSPLAVLDAVRHVLGGVGQGEIDFELSEADPFS